MNVIYAVLLVAMSAVPMHAVKGLGHTAPWSVVDLPSTRNVPTTVFCARQLVTTEFTFKSGSRIENVLCADIDGRPVEAWYFVSPGKRTFQINFETADAIVHSIPEKRPRLRMYWDPDFLKQVKEKEARQK